ncbi:MAG TPA: M14 family zinc carboxypeptidase [Thermomicrobiales bacterium]|nr:M14 family zinc carboxypeptidase [Thermomicrobiales bacterium]
MTDEGRIPMPEDVLGYQIGAPRRLPDWGEIVGYFDALAAASDRVAIERLGVSTDGRPYIAVFVSSPENLARRDELRSILARLYDPRGLDPADERELTERGKVTAFLLCTQHSNEIGAAVMTLELAGDLARATDPDSVEILDNVVTVMIPSHNPDGHQMIVEWYRQWLDTEYEGQPMPWLYHPYVGHDNNRDWFMLTQVESRLYADLHNRERPQLVFDMHQMMRDGARFMVPPFIDPLDPNQDPVIQQGFADLGTAIASRLTAAGKAGVATNIIFDNYSPSLAYGNYHGSVDILSEAASCRLATTVDIPEDKLKAERGFDPKVRSWNQPLPWKGGAWSLRDIVEYDKLAALAFLEHAARNRRQWLRNYVGITRRAVERTDGPYAFLVPPRQDDPGSAFELLDILRLGDVALEEATREFVADGVTWPAETVVVRLAQPSGSFAKTLLEVQSYPDLRRWPDGPPLAPYDIAGHTLPLQMGVRSVQIEKAFEAELRPAQIAPPVGVVRGEGRFGWAIPASRNGSVRALYQLLAGGAAVDRLTRRAGSYAPGTYVVREVERAVVENVARSSGVDVIGIDEPVHLSIVSQSLPRVGVYQSWKPSIDEGWLRWIFDDYGIPYETLHNADIRQDGLADRFDVVLLPQQPVKDMVEGNLEKNEYQEPYPPEYVGGLGRLGGDALAAFAEAGGTIVALDSACGFVLRHLHPPVRDVVEGVNEEEFYCPGSLLRVIVDSDHPLGWGMNRQEVALFMKSPVFEGKDDDQVQIVARYPEYEPNLSGWILGENKLAGKGALVEVALGAGRAVLIGFRPQFRAQARGGYRFLFNALARGSLGPERELSLG